MEAGLRLILSALFVILSCTATLANNATFTYLRTMSVEELNVILDTERAKFLATSKPGDGYVLPPVARAANAVDLYTVRYSSSRPELGRKPVPVSGLLAIPVVPAQSGVPLLAYQHGTVWWKYQVPSYAFKPKNPTGYPHYDGSYETRFMVGMFAGNGYAVMASDYIGMGDGARENEAYTIKGTSAQASYDLDEDVRRYLVKRSLPVSHVFLGGWSQGGLNTTGLLEFMEAKGVDVSGAFTAASPNDPLALMNGLLYHPRTIDASWINTLVALTAFSCEKYYGPKGLAKQVIDPRYFKAFKSIYERTYAGEAALFALLQQWEGIPLQEFFSPRYRDPSFFANSAYGKCLANGETYRQQFKADVRMYYGTVDEVVRDKVARLAGMYQDALATDKTLSDTSQISLFEIIGGDHRLTFVSAAAASKIWMDAFQ